MRTRQIRPHRALLLLAALDMAVCAAADTPATASGNTKPGFYAGGFRILPEVEAGGYYDDNIYATKRSRVSDAVALITPSVSLESQWERHRLDLAAGARIGRYLDTTEEDYEDLWLNAEGRYDLSADSQLNGGVGFSHNHEPRDSKENAQQQGVDEPTTYDVRSLQAGLDRRIGRIELKLGLTHETLDYGNVGALYNDDRDRAVSGLGLRVAGAINPRESLFVQGIANRRVYSDARDQYGYERDSRGYNAVVGYARKGEAGNRFEAFLGYLAQDYDDPRFDRLGTASYGVDFRWHPTQKTQFSGKLERGVYETTEVGSSGYLYTALDLQIDRKLSTDLLGYLNYNQGSAEFQEVGRQDDTRSVGAGLKYYMSPKIMLSGSYSFVVNDSNDRNSVVGLSDTYDYTRNLLFLTLKVRLAP